MLPRTFFNLSPGHPIGEKLASDIGASIGSFDTRLFSGRKVICASLPM